MVSRLTFNFRARYHGDETAEIYMEFWVRARAHSLHSQWLEKENIHNKPLTTVIKRGVTILFRASGTVKSALTIARIILKRDDCVLSVFPEILDVSHRTNPYFHGCSSLRSVKQDRTALRAVPTESQNGWFIRRNRFSWRLMVMAGEAGVGLKAV